MPLFQSLATVSEYFFWPINPDPLLWLNWHLEMVFLFVEGGKPKNPEKNPRSKARSNNKRNLAEPTVLFLRMIKFLNSNLLIRRLVPSER